MLSTFETFVFENWDWNPLTKKLALRYSLDSIEQFEEIWTFDFEFEKTDPAALRSAMHGLWIAAGVSYFKAALPQKIAFATDGVTPAGAEFFGEVWQQGLGEFFLQNKLDPVHPNFPATLTPAPGSTQKLNGSLLPIGGGKDSLVSALALEHSGENFETWTVGDSVVQSDCCEQLGVDRVRVRRKICPNLLRLNKIGALNGHVPISSILAFAGVATALLRGKKYVVLSNEASASEPNTEWRGMEVNHQWSKSLDFEKKFREYVHSHISPDVEYSSLLRPLTELHIAELFAKNGWDRFGNIFSSCNRNFHLSGSKLDAGRWCGECPKCVFVSIILAPWIDAVEIEKNFGSVPFAEEKNTKLLAELLGLQNFKPLECVGTIAEARLAAHLGAERHPSLKKWTEEFDRPELNHQEWHEHVLPDDLEKILKNVTK